MKTLKLLIAIFLITLIHQKANAQTPTDTSQHELNIFEKCISWDVQACTHADAFCTKKKWMKFEELNDMFPLGDSIESACGRDSFDLFKWSFPSTVEIKFIKYDDIKKEWSAWKEKNDPNSFDNLLQAGSLEEASKKAKTYDHFISLGWKYAGDQKYEQAFNSYKKGFELASTSKQKVFSYNAQVGVIDDMNLLDSAIRMQQRLPSKIKCDKYQTCQNKIAVGDLYFNHAQYQKALSQYQAALLIISEPEQHATVCGRLSECYYKLGDLANGKKYYIMSR